MSTTTCISTTNNNNDTNTTSTTTIKPRQRQVPAGTENAVEAELADEFVSLCAQYELKEPDLLLAATASGAPFPEHCLADDAAHRLLGLLLLVPHGPWKMSHAISGLVETSNNLASCQSRDVEGCVEG